MFNSEFSPEKLHKPNRQGSSSNHHFSRGYVKFGGGGGKFVLAGCQKLKFKEWEDTKKSLDDDSLSQEEPNV